MDLKKQVCSLEPAKRLKDLGAKQESYLYWRLPNEDSRAKAAGPHLMRADQNITETNWFDYYAAFTVAELENLLPEKIEYETSTTRKFAYLRMTKNHTVYESIAGFHPLPMQTDDEIANSRAKMLVYLLENGLLK